MKGISLEILLILKIRYKANMTATVTLHPSMDIGIHNVLLSPVNQIFFSFFI